MPSSATAAADGEQPRHEQDPHLRDERLDRARARRTARRATRGQERQLHARVGRVGQEDLRGEHEHEPVPRRGGPLQQARSRPAYSSSGPSWIIVSSRCVSGLSTGCRPVSATTTSANATAPSASAGLDQAPAPAVPATMPTRSVVPATSAATASASTSVASTKTEMRQVAAGAHQREAVRDVPRRGGDREPREREQPDEHERVVADAPVGRVGGDRDEQHGDRDARRGDRGREPVDDRRPLDVDRALAPQPAQLAVRLERRRPAAALQPRLPVLDEPGQKRRERDAADELDGGRRGGRARSSDHPDPRGGEQRRARARCR